MGLPIVVPTRSIGSLGPIKRNLHPPPRHDTYNNADEWNLLCDLVKLLCEELNALGLAGTTGTLQAAYNNAQAPNLLPVRIRLDTTRGGLIITNGNPVVPGVLLGVSDSLGAGEWGLREDGLLLPNLPTAIQSSTGTAVRLWSRSDLADPAFIFDTEGIHNGILLDVRNGLTRLWSVYASGAMVCQGRPVFPNPAPIFYRFTPTPEGISLGGSRPNTQEFGLVPEATGLGRLGTSSTRWGGVHAHYVATKKQTVAFAAIPVFDCRLGTVVDFGPLTGDVVSFGFSNAEEGIIMTLQFRQDGVGGRQLLDAPVRLQGSWAFGLSRSADAVDILVVQYTGGEWVELARNQQEPPERLTREQSPVAGLVTLNPHVDARRQSFSGALAGVLVVDLKSGAGSFAVNGDEFELVFPEVTGLTTTAANYLKITTDNGATSLAVFDQNKTLRGRILGYHTGTAWKLSIGSAVAYT